MNKPLVRKGDFAFIMKFWLVAVGFLAGTAMNMGVAHDPCGNEYDPDVPFCQWERTVNPYTGELESAYVCD